MKRAIIAAVLALAAAASTVAATQAGIAKRGQAEAATATPAQLRACRSKAIAISAPLTGPAAFLGQEQLSWAQFAVVNFNRQNKTHWTIGQGDTQLEASLARTVGRQLVSNKKVYGVVGPSTSQAVISSAGLFKAAHLAAVSPSATRVDLTNGRFTTFFRVVPNDAVQAPDIANFVAKKLKAKKAIVMDSQDDYSTALAPAIASKLQGLGTSVQRESVSKDATDFSSIVSKVGNDVGVFIFATQTASAAQQLSQQLLEQGKKALVFGTDGAYSPSQYKPRHGYVSSFANDIHFIKSAKATVTAYNRFSHNKTFGTFGPPSYMAAWVLMTAMNTACNDGKITRAEVTANVKRTNVPSILGGTVRFTARGDVRSPKFYIFDVKGSVYKLVG
jgi:branched-chain amino acid transport system substrate-binding protein